MEKCTFDHFKNNNYYNDYDWQEVFDKNQL